MGMMDLYGMIAGLGPTFSNAYDKAQTDAYGQQAADLYAKRLDAAGNPVATTPASGVSALSGPIAPAFAAGGGPGAGYLSTLIGRESGGDPNARNPNSSATGLGQFTTGTWNALAASHPELGLTPDGRSDVGQSTRALQAFTADNAGTLRSSGFDPNDGNLYVAHFLGAGGAKRFLGGLGANPDAPAATYVDPKSVAANRTIFYGPDGTPKSARDVYAGLTSKFGTGSTALAQQDVAAPPLPPARPAGVQVASADPNFAPRMPPEAAGQTPAQILVAQSAASGPQTPPATQPVPGGAASGLYATAAQADAQAGRTPVVASAAPPGGGDDDDGDDEAPAATGAVAATPNLPAARSPTPTLPSPSIRPGQVVYPGAAPPAATAVAGASSGIAALPMEQRAQLRQLLANPVTRAQAMATIDKLSAPDDAELKEVGGRLYRVNKRTGQASPVQGVGDNVERFDNNGTTYIRDKVTGETKVLIPSSKDETKDPDAVRKLTYARQNWKAAGLPDPTDPSNGPWWQGFAARTLGGGKTGGADTGPKVVPAGGALVGPDGKELYRGGAGASMDDDTADFLARRVVAGDTRALIGLGRGAQGAENLGKIQGRVRQIAAEQGLDASDLLHNSAVAAGMTAAERTGQTQEAKMGAAGFEANNMIDIALKASASVPRTTFVPVNRALQAWQTNTGSPEIRAFGATVNSLVNSYSRAINPTGVGTVADKEHARELISTADSPEAFKAVTDVLRQEIEAAHKSPGQAAQYREQQRQQRKTGASPAAPAPAFQEGATATHPQTGAKVRYQGGQWVPVTGPQS